MSNQGQRILASGDSFIGIFSLFTKDANIDIYKFKGATAKGLTKSQNENRLKLVELTSSHPSRYRCGIFSFGQVDLHHSFYYNIFAGKEDADNYADFYEILANNYVEFIASLDIPLKIITAVYPSPLKTSEVPRELLTYNILGITELLISSLFHFLHFAGIYVTFDVEYHI